MEICKERMEEYAPILIITMTRYEHFFRCLESLAKNSLAIKTDVYVGLDYPVKKEQFDGYSKIKEIIENHRSSFANIIVLEHSTNQGVLGNFYKTRDLLYEKYDRYIMTEDDNEFSPNFLEYMNKCMDKYKDDSNVIAIAGYSYPFNKDKLTGSFYSLDNYFAGLGYGIWKDTEKDLDQSITIEYFSSLFLNSHFMHKLKKASPNQFCNFVKGMVGYTGEMIKNNQMQRIDLAFGIYMFANSKNMIFPLISKVRNWGYDGSGVNCLNVHVVENGKNNHRNYDYSKQVLDAAERYSENELNDPVSQDAIKKEMLAFFEVGKLEFLRCKITYLLCRVFGRERVSKLIARLR